MPLRVDVLSDRYKATCLTCGLIVDVDDAHVCLPTQRRDQPEARLPTTEVRRTTHTQIAFDA